MGHTRDERTQHVAARWWWEVARREDSRGARRLSRQLAVDGVYRLDEGAVLDDFCHCLPVLGVRPLREEAHGTASQREMVPCGPYVGLDGLKTWCGLERINAWPMLLCSVAAVMRLVGCKAQQVRQGSGQRGATKRQVERVPGPR
jgi:hypothetical protein